MKIEFYTAQENTEPGAGIAQYGRYSIFGRDSVMTGFGAHPAFYPVSAGWPFSRG
jgi:hypothetical protein